MDTSVKRVCRCEKRNRCLWPFTLRARVKLRAGGTQPDSLAGVVVSRNRGGVRFTRDRSHDYSGQGMADRRPADPGGRIRIAFPNGVYEEALVREDALMMYAFDIQPYPVNTGATCDIERLIVLIAPGKIADHFRNRNRDHML